MFTELISVIVPVYNVEKYLSKCIDSILEQTYKNLEIILIDDGSTDNSGLICDKYAEKDTRIKVIHKKNGGLSDARNKGIEASTGKYIMFVDSDDYIKNTMISAMYNHIISDNTDMVICRFVHVDENGSVIKNFSSMPPYENIVISSDDILKWFSKENVLYFIVACCKLYKSQLWNDIRFPVGKIYEDEFVAHHIMGKCKQVSVIAEAYYYYLQHSGSITNSKITIKHFDAVEAFLNRSEYFLKRKMNLEAVNTFNRGVTEYIIRSNKMANDLPVVHKKKELVKNFRSAFIKNIFKFVKHCPIKSFVYMTLFVINPKLLELVLKILKSTK